MAEERLIDEDKDKNYRLNDGKDGETSSGDGGDNNEPAEDIAFVADEEQDEEAALLTPEQYAIKREREQKEREERCARARALVQDAVNDCKEEKFATALEFLEEAEELDESCGEIYSSRVRAYTRNFTDYSSVAKAAESAEGIKQYCSPQEKREIADKTGDEIEKNVAALRKEVASLNKENEEKKAERAVKFKRDMTISAVVFGGEFLILIAFFVLSLYFADIMYTVPTGLYIVLTCVFGALAFVALIFSVFGARSLVIACRRVKMNNRNTSTSLGRELLEKQAKLKAFLSLRDAIKTK